jgi:rubrerythrin
MTKKIQDLTPKEVLALAISIEQSNSKALGNFSHMFEGYDDEVSRQFGEMAHEEDKHEFLLTQRFKKMFEGPVPVVSNFDVEEVVEAFDLDDSEHLIFDSLKVKKVYQLVLESEERAKSFYQKASKAMKDHVLKNLFQALAEMEGDHAEWLEIKLGLKKGNKP